MRPPPPMLGLWPAKQVNLSFSRELLAIVHGLVAQ